jgi:peptidoglycan/LPS O-acetylase OafA/YrhL
LDRTTSIYLDLVRFLAAVAVFLSHVGTRAVSDGFLWQFMPLGAPAVIVFWVLSGYVIAHSVQGNPSLRDYTVARAARIYSVVVPTLLATIVIDELGRWIAPANYANCPSMLADPWSIPLALSFLNEAWGGCPKASLGSNGAYWSLGYEVPFYALFAGIHFLHGRTRIVCCSLLALLAGPQVIGMFPLWWLGRAAYDLSWHHRIRPHWGWVLWIGSVVCGVALVCCARSPFNLTEHGPFDLAVDALLALLFLVHIAGFQAIGGSILRHALAAWEQPIRWLAGATFTLYLLHQPTIAFLKALSPWAADTWQFRVGILLLPMFAVFAFAHFTERKKIRWRTWLDRWIPGTPRPNAANGSGFRASPFAEQQSWRAPRQRGRRPFSA